MRYNKYMKKNLDNHNFILGTVVFAIETSGVIEDVINTEYGKFIKTNTFDIYIKKKENLNYNPEVKTNFVGWECYFKKRKDVEEKINIQTTLMLNETNNISYDYAGGEHLCAVEISNTENFLVIGTEDFDLLSARGTISERMISLIPDGEFKDFNRAEDGKLTTNIPDLIFGEGYYIQHFVAESNDLFWAEAAVDKPIHKKHNDLVKDFISSIDL